VPVRANERAIDNKGEVNYSEQRTPAIEKRILTVNYSLAYPGGKSTRGFLIQQINTAARRRRVWCSLSSSQDTAVIRTSRTATISTYEDENEHDKKQLTGAIVREREDEERLTSASQHDGEKHGRIQTFEEASVTGYLKE